MKEKVSQLKEKLINGLNKFYLFIDRVGKRNFILAICVLFTLVITGLYVTFSLYTSSEGLSILDGIKTYKFILGADNTENSVTIAAGTSKNIAITVTNSEKMKLKYGIYYTSSDDLTDVELGYKHDTEHLPNGSIESSQSIIITLQIDNNSSSNITIKFGILYGVENGGDLVLSENQHFLEKKWNFPLSEVEVGSYVAYQGNNGCTGASCSGQNANYVSDSDMGYCYDSSYKFNVNGWRVGYIKNDSSYLISAGAPECIATDSNGDISSTNASSSESTSGLPAHLNHLISNSLNYCNIGYIYNGICISNVIWPMNPDDFKEITGNILSNDSCFQQKVSEKCGYGNDLIDNGGDYWFAAVDNSNRMFNWYPNSNGGRYVSNSSTYAAVGVRPVLRLSSSVIVTDGTGTYENPYKIDNPDTVKDLSGNMNNGVGRNEVNWEKNTGTYTTNGSTSYLECGFSNYQFSDQVTFIVRIKFNEIDSNMTEQDILTNFESAGVGLYLKNTYLAFSVFTSQYNSFYSTTVPEIGVWYTIVGVYNGSEVSLYLNGTKLILNTSISGSTSTASGIPKKTSLPIITGNPTAEGSAVGLINATYQNILIFDRALTETEIISNYSDEIQVTNTDDLLLYYDFKR